MTTTASGAGGASALRVIPCKHADANEFVRKLHRHNRPTLGAILCAAVADDGGVRGVAIAGRPVARKLDDGLTLEVLRVCTDGARNACSMLYRAICRAARALGYASVITYTLPDEGGASLRGAGFVLEGAAGGRGAMWGTRTARAMEAVGDDMVGGKLRWRCALALQGSNASPNSESNAAHIAISASGTDNERET